MDAFSLLCEGCGYELEGAPGEGLCPECGRPVAESLPEHRAGTAWQRSPGLFSWALTCKRVLFGAEREFGRVSLRLGCRGLLIVNAAVAAALIVAPWTGVLIGDPARAAHGGAYESVVLLVSFVVQAAIGTIGLYLATVASVAAVMALGRSRGWRLTRRAAWCVACHASAGWILAGVLPLLLMAVWYTLGTLLKIPVPGVIPGRVRGMQISWQTVLGAGAPVLGFALGTAVFVLRLLAGARACRFAADPREPTRA
jgi:hypothetical protein